MKKFPKIALIAIVALILAAFSVSAVTVSISSPSASSVVMGTFTVTATLDAPINDTGGMPVNMTFYWRDATSPGPWIPFGYETNSSAVDTSYTGNFPTATNVSYDRKIDINATILNGTEPAVSSATATALIVDNGNMTITTVTPSTTTQSSSTINLTATSSEEVDSMNAIVGGQSVSLTGTVNNTEWTTTTTRPDGIYDIIYRAQDLGDGDTYNTASVTVTISSGGGGSSYLNTKNNIESMSGGDGNKTLFVILAIIVIGWLMTRK